MRFEIMNHDHLDKCAVIFVEAFRKKPWLEDWTYDQAYQRLQDLLSAQNVFAYVCLDHQEIIGMICGRQLIYLDYYELWIDELCISNQYAGRGIGSTILNFVKEECQKKQIKRIVLNTIRSYLSDVFYYKNGFKEAEDMVCLKFDL